MFLSLVLSAVPACRCSDMDGIDEAKKQQKDGLLSEDALKTAEEKFQKATDAHINDINKLLAEKEKEIMEG